MTVLDLEGYFWDTDIGANTETSNVLVLLQSLDMDRDPSNGIEISEQARAAAQSLNDFSALISSPPIDFASSSIVIDFVAEATGSEVLIEASLAQAHFSRTLEELGDDYGHIPTTTEPSTGTGGPDGPVTVAFIADQGIDAEAREVLRLIKERGAELVVIAGDLGYNEEDPSSPQDWLYNLNSILGRNFPAIIAIGNHDTKFWSGSSGYAALIAERNRSISSVQCSGTMGTKEMCSYRGLDFVVSGIGTLYGSAGSGHESFISDSLRSSDAIWKTCVWHKNQKQMQVGNKSSEIGWEAYELCRENGAIIATGHEHSYSRTKTLSHMQSLQVSNAYPSGSSLRVEPGKSFAFVSGLGGFNVRAQQRCLSGCNEWASIYTSNQGAVSGALFITFHADNDPRKAKGEFVDIYRGIVDSFVVTSGN